MTPLPNSTLERLGREIVDCPCCGNNGHSKWGEERGFAAVKCSECGAVYVRERPNADSISAAARDGIHQTKYGNLDQRYGYRRWKVPYYTSVVRRFFEEEDLEWLDVGAGYGEFVQAVKKALPNARPIGIDPMKAKVDWAKSRGIPIEQKTLAEVEGKYDVISLINVFSHIPNFQAFGDQVKALIKPGGSLFMETGNGGDLENRAHYPGELLLPDHLVFAGVNQMYRLLSRMGFSRIEHYSRRIDHPWWAAKQSVKNLLNGKPHIAIPYTRQFRTVFYRAFLD